MCSLEISGFQGWIKNTEYFYFRFFYLLNFRVTSIWQTCNNIDEHEDCQWHKETVTTSADQLFRGLPFTFESLASKNVMLFVHWNQMQVSSSHTFAFDSGKACYQIVLKNRMLVSENKKFGGRSTIMDSSFQ